MVDCLFERSRMASGDIVVSGHVKSDNMGRRNVDLSGASFEPQFPQFNHLRSFGPVEHIGKIVVINKMNLRNKRVNI